MADADLKLLYRELVSLEIELWDGIEGRLRAEYDLALTSFEVLHLLLRRPGRRIQDIAEEFSITVGGTSKVVDRLEAAGLCARRANPNDRRSSIVELTSAGRKLVDGALKVFEEELELRIGSVIPEQSVREVTAVLSTLRAAGRALDAERRAAAQTPVSAARAPKRPGGPRS
ncbi:MarR family winged helix-turn-helix transcriptional regulator [Streptomyces europaeiscabiei]|uniref:MarR family transcriptional regulator n=1 Tax=Streptomyces europaeiscabiei TaxID=146819 RepID=A0ABU4NJS6_9ACTN|nr:MarR family transcriptional regulator [Streptomyces europaeiscabiei]MDX2524482.1 MarR family transcriptional regulator [Streptomyces europaeiscabiei]MDX2757078.1 MarR family transcriptional regulator [Streptomyces europaeiscabiei]MDX2768019.1 MarR family transcriptional regulator [Streptomyces europaeiscabiei]MDX3545746.1 MarR family transcriptional regulator [Streptomyces europaeiscabiei]MDX3554856.1 MarR family transcriptional regulator [Streptomyces europaeiscabiei]